MALTNKKLIQVGLRIDVDTLSGTRQGIPYLLELFAKRHICSSIFFSVGPDNMGRHLWRLLKPAFLIKMLRSNAASLYGWSILLQGTFWPGAKIGKKAQQQIRAAFDAGHEIGLHAWDHHAWQMKVDNMDRSKIAEHIKSGMTELTRILNQSVSCSAVAGWKCTEQVLQEKQTYSFVFNSDCRGSSIFLPKVNNKVLDTPQIPVTLPTYDEIIGSQGITDANYNEHLLSLIKPGQLNVLTIHAEVEGLSRRQLFEDFLDMAAQKGVAFNPLSQLLSEHKNKLPICNIELKPLPGREGTVCWQGPELLS